MEDLMLSVNLIDVSDDYGDDQKTCKHSSGFNSRLDSYKKRATDFKSDQEKRRKQFLIEQKE
jgi:hypothetical protein